VALLRVRWSSSLPRLVFETEADGVLGDGPLDLIGDAVWKSGINFHTLRALLARNRDNLRGWR
jgi:hypothetical protein